jgi:hypothetical protein
MTSGALWRTRQWGYDKCRRAKIELEASERLRIETEFDVAEEGEHKRPKLKWAQIEVLGSREKGLTQHTALGRPPQEVPQSTGRQGD